MRVQLGYRLSHIMRRLLPVAMYLLQRDGQCLNGHDLFLKRVGACYHAFVDEVEKACKVTSLAARIETPGVAAAASDVTTDPSCSVAAGCVARADGHHHRLRSGSPVAAMAVAAAHCVRLEAAVRSLSSGQHPDCLQNVLSSQARCMEDLASTTRYVNWSLHTRNPRALQQLLTKVRGWTLRRLCQRSGTPAVALKAPFPPATWVARSRGHAACTVRGWLAVAEPPPTPRRRLGVPPAASPPCPSAAQGVSSAEVSQGKNGPPSGKSDMTTGQQLAGVMMDVLDCTLWQRQLTAMSEEIVAALVCQV